MKRRLILHSLNKNNSNNNKKIITENTLKTEPHIIIMIEDDIKTCVYKNKSFMF